MPPRGNSLYLQKLPGELDVHPDGHPARSGWDGNPAPRDSADGHPVDPHGCTARMTNISRARSVASRAAKCADTIGSAARSAEKITADSVGRAVPAQNAVACSAKNAVARTGARNRPRTRIQSLEGGSAILKTFELFAGNSIGLCRCFGLLAR